MHGGAIGKSSRLPEVHTLGTMNVCTSVVAIYTITKSPTRQARGGTKGKVMGSPKSVRYNSW